jgi:hypothetical protein
MQPHPPVEEQTGPCAAQSKQYEPFALAVQSVFDAQPHFPPGTQTGPFALAVQSVLDAQPQVCAVGLQKVPDGFFAQSAPVTQPRQSPLVVSHAGAP